MLRRGATPAVLRLYDQAESTRQFSGASFDGGGCLLLVLDEGDPEAIDWSLAVERKQHCLRQLYRTLIGLRRDLPGLRLESFGQQEVWCDERAKTLSFRRSGGSM